MLRLNEEIPELCNKPSTPTYIHASFLSATSWRYYYLVYLLYSGIKVKSSAFFSFLNKEGNLVVFK